MKQWLCFEKCNLLSSGVVRFKPVVLNSSLTGFTGRDLKKKKKKEQQTLPGQPC